MDETLIHCKRDEYYDEVDSGCEIFKPDITVDVEAPDGEKMSTGFSIRPYALDCLKVAN